MKQSVQFWDLVSTFRRKYREACSPLYRKYGLKQNEFDVLMFLHNNPEADTAARMIEQRGFSKSQVSSSVSHLMEKGLLEASYHNDNRKSIHLCPSASAEQIVTEGKHMQDLFLQKLLQGIPEAEINAAADMMQTMLANMKEMKA